MRLNFLNVPSLASIAVAALVAGVFASAGTTPVCAIGAALATAFLIQVRFFYEVPEANKFERICAFLVLVLMVAGLWFATVVTLNIMAGIFFGIVIPAMIRRVFKL
ncbi:MAG: hypothetical protein IPP57_28640 [Candidatus Obscuribacter sp.]|jgi:hypothetical protein|nr:hypothetical protein [Candidatus Obscuribacter sp.]MDQ5965161.1 hypothetical protein [Cyanobacteriota bacterium erpe_2018_sw_39hr_WHONDRS-SW48-000098_B_bin.30]MBK7838441.1 hypothetical protein [Candidatus Obscuribacter sp.]MBK9201057.1 hypothetical protein [Candidatus Obscuribacter sp.]MBK9621724.1 hypothetical protein [Candidatus Obscuribacter sp.]